MNSSQNSNSEIEMNSSQNSNSENESEEELQKLLSLNIMKVKKKAKT